MCRYAMHTYKDHFARADRMSYTEDISRPLVGAFARTHGVGHDMTVRRRRVVLVFIVVIVAGAYLLLSVTHASYIYAVEAEFAVLPPDDTRLEQWLAAQPGVVAHTVMIQRVGANETVLKVSFIQSRNLLGRPKMPALEQACRDLGYGPPISQFRDLTYR